jgi:hypothetical protein
VIVTLPLPGLPVTKVAFAVWLMVVPVNAPVMVSV